MTLTSGQLTRSCPFVQHNLIAVYGGCLSAPPPLNTHNLVILNHSVSRRCMKIKLTMHTSGRVLTAAAPLQQRVRVHLSLCEFYNWVWHVRSFQEQHNIWEFIAAADSWLDDNNMIPALARADCSERKWVESPHNYTLKIMFQSFVAN